MTGNTLTGHISAGHSLTGRLRRRLAATVLTLLLTLGGAGCSSLLDVSDPTAIEEADAANATGADLMRRNALGKLYNVFGDAAIQSGLLTDEFFADPRPQDVQTGVVTADQSFDQRLSERLEVGADFAYRRWQEARQSATTAIEQLQVYAAEEIRQAHIGQMLAVRGYTVLALAEDYCSGFPLHEVVNDRFVAGPSATTAQAYERALADFDSAAVYAADSARIRDFARIGRARALLGLGRFTEAAAAVTQVPTVYVWNAEYTTSGSSSRNPLVFTRTATNARRSVANAEGGTGLDFRSAGDPRVKTTALGAAHNRVDTIYAIAKYPNQAAPIVLASGVEARLIEAEAALQAGGDWLGILNQLRAAQITPAMAPLSDPGTPEARVDLLFRERAFWLFATGHRLGDLRRLVHVYGRSPESVFPSGSYRLGGTYGAATSSVFAIAKEAAINPAVTGCLGS